MNEFTKYREQGAYHWKHAFPQNRLQYSPRHHAIYDVPLRLLAKHLVGSCHMGADVGCGDGLFTYKAMQKGHRIIGIDRSADGLALARHEIGTRGFKSPWLVRGDCSTIPLPPRSLDYIVALELIEHLEQPAIFLAEVSKLVKSGGIFVCTTPLSRSDIIPDPFHVKEFDPEELAELLSLHFDNVVVKGMYPDWLDNVYRNFTRFQRVNGLIKRVINLISVFYNPFSGFVYQDPHSGSCKTLVGFGKVR